MDSKDEGSLSDEEAKTEMEFLTGRALFEPEEKSAELTGIVAAGDEARGRSGSPQKVVKILTFGEDGRNAGQPTAGK